MAVGQDTIWYITADSYTAAVGSPQLEAFKAKGIEVLLMSDRIDEWMLGSLNEYAGKKLKNVAKGELPLDEADKKQQEEASKAAEPVAEEAQGAAGRSRGRSAACRPASPTPRRAWRCRDYEMAPHLARLLREAGHDVPDNKPTLEINPAASAAQARGSRRRSRPRPRPGQPAAGAGGDLRRCAAAGSGGVSCSGSIG